MGESVGCEEPGYLVRGLGNEGRRGGDGGVVDEDCRRAELFNR